jgi:putative endonuclease
LELFCARSNIACLPDGAFLSARRVSEPLEQQSRKVTRQWLKMSKEYYVYIMTNKSRTLYTGMTNDLMRRVYEHKNKLAPGFTSKYNIQFLVYYETTSSVQVALEREKQIKGWLRTKKIALIESVNPEWNDLSEEWFVKPNSTAT